MHEICIWVYVDEEGEYGLGGTKIEVTKSAADMGCSMAGELYCIRLKVPMRNPIQLDITAPATAPGLPASAQLG
jgi:hypothetical protein